MVDLRPSVSSCRSYTIRNLHKEIFQFSLLDVNIKIPEFDVSQIRQYGSVVVSVSSLNGWLLDIHIIALRMS